MFTKFLRDEDGFLGVEWMVMLAIITVAVIAVVTLIMEGGVTDYGTDINDYLLQQEIPE